MSLIDIHAKGGFENQPLTDAEAMWFVDGDGVMFDHDEAELFPDAERFLDTVGNENVVIVSANNNLALERRRRAVVNPRLYVSAHSRIPPWSKYTIYRQAAEEVIESGHEPRVGMVVDDRWLMGCVVGKFALFDAGFAQAKATFLDRGLEPNYAVDRGLAVLQLAGVLIAKRTGLDELIRPRV